MDKHIVKDVVEQIINLLTSSVIEENGTEGFESWCETDYGYPVFESEEQKQVAKRIAPFVDELSNEIERILNE